MAISKKLHRTQGCLLALRDQRESKILLLESYWLQFIQILYARAKSLKDNKTKLLAEAIMKIPEHIRTAVLRHIVKKASELQAIAFFQWRLRAKANAPAEEIELLQEVIATRMRTLYRPLLIGCRHILPSKFDSKKKETQFYKTYTSLFPPQHVPYHINQIEQLGLHHPFLDDRSDSSFTAPSEVTFPVYPAQRYSTSASPRSIFVPSIQILFTLMRASIGVTKEEELWFHENKDISYSYN